MFSGIIEAVGSLESLVRTGAGARMIVDVRALAVLPAPGDSVAVDGACLTVEQVKGTRVELALSEETLQKTRFAALRRGARLNIERAVRADQALHGHIVTGHVDGMADVVRVQRGHDSTVVEFSVDRRFETMIVPKGSVAINGVSLTVASLSGRAFSVALVPYTLRNTNLPDLSTGDRAHFEADIIGKYVLRYLSTLPITRDDLRERGFDG
ncbi:MAG: riboflavin synthase [Acidobacteriota bacterium]